MISQQQTVWSVQLLVARPLDSMPRPFRLAEEIATSPAYRSEGRLRRSEQHCIYHHCLSGCGSVFRGGRSWAVPAGSGFLALIDEPDAGYAYPISGSEPWRFWWFGFLGGNVRQQVAELLDRCGPVFAPPTQRGVVAELRRFGGADAGLRLDPFQGARLVTELLTTLGQAAEASQTPSQAQGLVERVRLAIERDLPAVPAVAALARAQGVSREHLSRLFRAETGTSVQRYSAERRMTCACRLLKDTPLGIADVARRLGFSTPANFARSFRAVIGLSPGDFRRIGMMPAYA